MRNFVAASLSALLLILSVSACGGGGSSGGGGGGGNPTPQAPYDIQVTTTNYGGLQVNRPFSISLGFTQPGTSNPINVASSESITCSVVSGPGTLTGATSTSGNGSATLTFSGIVLNAVGTYVLSFNGPNATAPAQTASFSVDAQRDLRFASVPASVGVNSVFSVTVETIDPATSNPAPPSSPIDITLSIATGSGTLHGTLTRTLSSGSSLAFPGLLCDTVGTITLRATSNGYPDATSNSINIAALSFTSNIGPFVALKSVRVNNSYSDSIAFAAANTALGFGIMNGSTLPAGLSLDPVTGTISGAPTSAASYEFILYASMPGLTGQQIRCALAVFSQAESEIVASQDFSTPGPHSTSGPVTETYTFSSSYDGISYPQAATFNCRIQYYYPNFATAPSPAPVLVHHRGRGFSMFDYPAFGTHVASYGFIFITIEDYQSFADSQGYYGSVPGSGWSPNSTYDISQAERGMQSASAFQEAVMNWVIAKNSQSGHNLQNRVDEEKIFVSGHSRGGGATHGSHQRSQPYMFNGTQRTPIHFRGAIYFMAYDLRYFSSTAFGNSTVYPITNPQPRLPSLLIAGENDGDLIYPICDQLIDRANGPTTFATIYGGCHGFLTDTGTYDASQAYITRSQQQARMFNLVIAFLKRWADLDLSLEGLLYCNEKAGSSEVGVTAWRNMAERVVIDDMQNSNKNLNTVGGSNTFTGGTWTANSSIYPNYGSFSSLAIRHAIFSVPANTTATYTSNIPTANQDVSHCKRLIFRAGTVDMNGQSLKGFDWVTLRVRLTDAQNDTATVTLFDRAAQNANYLPNYPGNGSNVYDRFVEASVNLSTFTATGPNLGLNQLTKVELIFETAAGTTRQMYFDDLRFE